MHNWNESATAAAADMEQEVRRAAGRFPGEKKIHFFFSF